MHYFIHLGKCRQHSLLTAIDQITSKPKRAMFLWREPLVPRWAPVKEVAKIQLTLLPNCKEPGCITLLAALSIPKEALLGGIQAQPPPGAARSALQLGEAHAATRGWGGGQQRSRPRQLEPRCSQPPSLLLPDAAVWVPPRPLPGPRGDHLMWVLCPGGCTTGALKALLVV